VHVFEPSVVESSKVKMGAFETYVVPEMPTLRYAARSLTRHQHDADDLLQDTLLRAFRAVDRFDGTYPRAWLLTILRNTHINRNRRQRPQLLHDHDDVDRVRGRWCDGPDQDVERDLDWVLEAALEQLPAAFRDVVELVDVRGLTYAEAAGALEVPTGTVMSRLHRGRRHMRRTIEQLAA
jgi:RNA polymerase sigma-70 factor, ECF subfamily